MTDDPTLPPEEVLRALRRRRSVRAWRANDPKAWQPRFRASFIDDEDDEDDGPVAPRGDHAPPPDLVEAMQDCDPETARDGGAQRIIHRINYAALEDTARRIAPERRPRPVLGPHPNAVSKGRPQMANPIHRKPSQRRIDSIVRRLARENGDKASKP